MVAFRANPGVFTWRAPNGRGGSFQPQGKVVFVGDKELLDFQKNPETWESADTLSSRIIVGLNVGGDPRWKIEDVISVVRDIRERIHDKPGATFIAQKGVYRHRESGEVVEEDGVQVIIIDLWATPEKAFRAEMVSLGEELAGQLQQEEVIVEIQKNGVTQTTIGVTP
jgi:hypothetical protein